MKSLSSHEGIMNPNFSFKMPPLTQCCLSLERAAAVHIGPSSSVGLGNLYLRVAMDAL